MTQRIPITLPKNCSRKTFPITLPEPSCKQAFATQLYPFCNTKYALAQLNRLLDRCALRPTLENMGISRHARILSSEAQLLIYAAYLAERREQQSRSAAM